MISFQKGYFIHMLKENLYFSYSVHGKRMAEATYMKGG